MKKLIFILMAALAFSCTDGNRSSERDEDDGLETEETLEPSTEESDTTSTWDQDRDREHESDRMDDMDESDATEDNDESGARRDTTTRDND